jgi:arabinose-5-phosphate isomerase
MEESQRLCDMGLAVIETELQAVERLKQQVNKNFANACQLLLNCKGRIVVTGMGKSGHIGSKIAATLASTGSPAFFVHPGEASHGDLGMITQQDVVIAISYSGETQEVNSIVPIIKRFNIPMLAITGNSESSLARAANFHLSVKVEKEACPLNLAPTASTTATLVIGDALAVALLEAKGFTKEDFALSHPGGSLGKRLLLRIADVMHTGKQVPKVNNTATVNEALVEMSDKSLGMTAVVNEEEKFLGIFTDGDLRRALDKEINVKTTKVSEVMTANATCITADMLAAEALQLMEQRRFNGLFILNEQQQPIGAINMHDLLRAGVL